MCCGTSRGRLYSPDRFNKVVPHATWSAYSSSYGRYTYMRAGGGDHLYQTYDTTRDIRTTTQSFVCFVSSDEEGYTLRMYVQVMYDMIVAKVPSKYKQGLPSIVEYMISYIARYPRNSSHNFCEKERGCSAFVQGSFAEGFSQRARKKSPTDKTWRTSVQNSCDTMMTFRRRPIE